MSPLEAAIQILRARWPEIRNATVNGSNVAAVVYEPDESDPYVGRALAAIATHLRSDVPRGELVFLPRASCAIGPWYRAPTDGVARALVIAGADIAMMRLEERRGALAVGIYR